MFRVYSICRVILGVHLIYDFRKYTTSNFRKFKGWNKILIYDYQRITILDILERALIILRMILWSRNFIKYNFYLFVINYLNSFQCKVQAQEL